MAKRKSGGSPFFGYAIVALVVVAVAVAFWKVTVIVAAIAALVYMQRQSAKAVSGGRTNWATRSSAAIWHSRSSRGRLGTMSAGALGFVMVASAGGPGLDPAFAGEPPSPAPFAQMATPTPRSTVAAAPTATVKPAPLVTEAPTHAPTPTPAPTPVVVPAPEPTVVPEAEPAELAIRVTKLTASVRRGSTASITIKTAGKAECSISVEYKSGPSTANGLGDKTANSSGIVTWSWKVGSSTTRGSWPIYIDCSRGDLYGSISREFTVK